MSDEGGPSAGGRGGEGKKKKKNTRLRDLPAGSFHRRSGPFGPARIRRKKKEKKRKRKARRGDSICPSVCILFLMAAWCSWSR